MVIVQMHLQTNIRSMVMSIVPVKIADIIEVVKIVILKIILNIVPKQKGAQHDLTV